MRPQTPRSAHSALARATSSERRLVLASAHSPAARAATQAGARAGAPACLIVRYRGTGVYATVLGVSKGELWIQWPGEIKSPLPSKAKCKQDMETYGYFRMPNWAHIQRSIDERSCALFNQKYKGGPPPRQSAMWLPNYTSASAGAAAGPGVSERPMTAPA